MAMTPAAFESPPKRVCKNRPNAAICRTVIRTAGLEWAARRERCQGAIHSPFLEHQPASRNDPPGPSNPVVRAYRLRPWTASGALHSPSAPDAVAPSAPEAIALPKVAIGPSCALPASSHPAPRPVGPAVVPTLVSRPPSPLPKPVPKALMISCASPAVAPAVECVRFLLFIAGAVCFLDKDKPLCLIKAARRHIALERPELELIKLALRNP